MSVTDSAAKNPPSGPSKTEDDLPPTTDRPGGVSISSDIVMISDADGARAEAVRAMRTHLMAQHIHGGRRALAVCAASAGVGCSFVAANLAVSLAQIGSNVLLIDGDLRNPSLAKMIAGADAGPGLIQCLNSADAGFGDNIVGDVLPHLSVLYSGGKAANPQELLAGERFGDLMSFCLRTYDVTIVDTPPASTCSDARRISTVVGYSLVVARKDISAVEDVKLLVEELQVDHARVIGTVLNGA